MILKIYFKNQLLCDERLNYWQKLELHHLSVLRHLHPHNSASVFNPSPHPHTYCASSTGCIYLLIMNLNPPCWCTHSLQQSCRPFCSTELQLILCSPHHWSLTVVPPPPPPSPFLPFLHHIPSPTSSSPTGSNMILCCFRLTSCLFRQSVYMTTHRNINTYWACQSIVCSCWFHIFTVDWEATLLSISWCCVPVLYHYSYSMQICCLHSHWKTAQTQEIFTWDD